ncbi:MAG TPA: LLM class F420-dependent oxidoreductase [Candidatus Entotheonella sp.]
MSVQMGAFFPTRDMPADRIAIRDWAQAAEAIGFDFVEVPDHVLGADRAALPDFEGPYDVDDSFHETFVTLAYIAAVTERVGLASGVLILPQRQTALVAKQAAQLDVVSGGRLRLGIGVGWNPVEYEALGQDWQRRGRRQAEQIELMNQLWTNRTVTFDGVFDRVHHAGLNPLPIQQPIPIWFGGGVEPVLQRAAKYGQGWIPLGQPDEQTEGQLQRLRNYLRAEGRDPAAFGIEAWVRSGIGGPDQWRTAAARWAALGATHVTFYTSGQGMGGVEHQIEAMRQFRDAVQ